MKYSLVLNIINNLSVPTKSCIFAVDLLQKKLKAHHSLMSSVCVCVQWRRMNMHC